jgi:flagellar hook assembly protein FlgD
MWQPKNNTNDMFIGRETKVYHKDGNLAAEGKLTYIKECLNKKGSYSVSVLNNNGYTNHVCTSDIIGKVDVKIFEIGNEVKNIKELPDDCCNIINKFVYDYIEI